MSRSQIIQKFKQALQQEDIRAVRELLRIHSKYNLNMADEHGNALSLSFFNDLKKINLYKLAELKELGANFNIQSNDGKNLLNKIIVAENIAATKTILELSDSSLVDSGDAHGNSPLTIAVKTGNKNMMTMLLTEFGANPNKLNNDGKTLLHQVVEADNYELAKILLEAGALPKLIDGKGKPPLHYAFKKQRIDLIELLVEKGADINYQDQYGEALLAKAAGGSFSYHFYNYILVQKLILLDADINVKRKNGESVISKMVESGDVDSLKLVFITLLQFGRQNSLKIETVINEGKNWAKIAIENKNAAILKLLIANNVDMPKNCTSKDSEIKKILKKYNEEQKSNSKIEQSSSSLEDDSNYNSEADEESSSSSNSEVEDLNLERVASSEEDTIFTKILVGNYGQLNNPEAGQINDADYLSRLGDIIDLEKNYNDHTF